MLSKRKSLIFVRDNRRFYPLPEYEYLSFKGVLFYGEIAKLMKEYINIYELGGKNVYNKNDAFVLACEKVDNKQEFKYCNRRRGTCGQGSLVTLENGYTKRLGNRPYLKAR